MVFKWAIASEIGTSHLKNETKKQDCARCFTIEGKVLAALVFDGAGSTKFGRAGAIKTCKVLSNEIKFFFINNLILPSDEQIWQWIDNARDEISSMATNLNTERKEFSTTIINLIVTNDEVLILHIGDGAVVARNNDFIWTTISEPDNGEYASTTYFITQDPFPKLRISRLKNHFNAFSVFSDGIEDLALVQLNKTPHAPFFEKMIKSIDDNPKKGNLDNLSNALSDFLLSEKVCDRTDDDKSLILISIK